jgi:hypothetical protein
VSAATGAGGGETEVGRFACGLLFLDDEGGQIVEEKAQVQVEAQESCLDDVEPVVASVFGQGIRGPAESVALSAFSAIFA